MASQKLFYSVDEVCEATGIRRSLLYELVRRGEIPSRKLGKRRLFPVEALRHWAAGTEPDSSLETPLGLRRTA